jgi:Beta/Gamma crystallin
MNKIISFFFAVVFVLPSLTKAQVTIFQHCDYSGSSQSLTTGKYNLGQFGISNDNISSIMTSEGWYITLYEHDNFNGTSITFKNGMSSRCLVEQGFNDKTSSLIVGQLVTLYKDCYFQGISRAIPIGYWNVQDIERWIGNDELSSIRIPPGIKVTVYEHADFTGDSRTFYGSSSCLAPMGWNDRVSSIKIEIY